MSDLVLVPYVHLRSLALGAIAHLHRDQRGEGVISAAIAVLVMAFLGVAMWVAFKAMFSSTTAKTGEQMSQIGS